jgi:hypothetical protein
MTGHDPADLPKVLHVASAPFTRIRPLDYAQLLYLTSSQPAQPKRQNEGFAMTWTRAPLATTPCELRFCGFWCLI